MGVWMYLLVAPGEPFKMSREQFAALIRDMLDKKLAAMPCAILGGNLSVDHPLGVANAAAFFDREKRDGIEVYYRGQDEVSLLKTLSEFPFGQSDLCIWFSCFNWENPSIREDFSQRGYANADILLYALAEPRIVQCHDLYQGTIGEEHRLQYCIRTTGKGAPWDITGTPLEPLLMHHFGADLIIDCTYA